MPALSSPGETIGTGQACSLRVARLFGRGFDSPRLHHLFAAIQVELIREADAAVQSCKWSDCKLLRNLPQKGAILVEEASGCFDFGDAGCGIRFGGEGGAIFFVGVEVLEID